MKKSLFLFLVLSVSFSALSQEKKGKFVLGANLMYRYISIDRSYYCYPRISFEYCLSGMSSFECMAEYIDYSVYNRRNVSFPLSAGYKLNLIPAFTRNEKITERLRVYGALRYTLLPAAANPDKPFKKFYVFHYIRFALGTEYYFNRQWGVTAEKVLGHNMRSTWGLGVKYRF